jgi:hypothetical protein
MTDSKEVSETVSPDDDLEDDLSELARLRQQNSLLRAELAKRSAPDLPSDGDWRRPWMSITCAVIGAILLPVAVITVWARDTMLDTDEYVATVGPLVEDENIQEAVSFRVTEAVSEAADFRSIAEDALPEEAQVLAGPIEAGAKTVVADVVGGIVATDAFADFWTESHRVAHQNLVPLLKGESSDAVSTSEGRVVLLLGPLAAQALEGVDEELDTELGTQIPTEELDAELVLLESEDLANAQTLVGWFDAISWLWLLLTLGFLAGAVLLAQRRRSGFRRLGFAVTVPMVLTLVAYAWIRSRYLAELPEDVHNPDAAAAVFDILTNYLLRSLRVLLVVGLLIMFGAWVVGPTEGAARVRAGWDTLLGRAGATSSDRQAGPIAKAAAAHERGLLTGTAILGGLVLVIWTRPTGLVVLLIAALTLLVIGGIRILAEIARRSEATELEQALELEEAVLETAEAEERHREQVP